MKNILFITILLGVGYSQDCDPGADVGYNCDCNEYTWQEDYPHMQGCYLEGAWLPGANLEGANLEGANLNEANLTGANLIGANLINADLYDVDFIYALLIGANFQWTYLHQVDFVGANLSYANFSDAYFYMSNLTNTIWDECAIVDENIDGYDDVSYEAGAASGDVNLDGNNNILDIITLANIIIEE